LTLFSAPNPFCRTCELQSTFVNDTDVFFSPTQCFFFLRSKKERIALPLPPPTFFQGQNPVPHPLGTVRLGSASLNTPIRLPPVPYWARNHFLILSPRLLSRLPNPPPTKSAPFVLPTLCCSNHIGTQDSSPSGLFNFFSLRPFSHNMSSSFPRPPTADPFFGTLTAPGSKAGGPVFSLVR